MKKVMIQMPGRPAGLSELDQLLGERLAFSRMADSASAADADCLRRIRDERMYRLKNVNWAQFCAEYLDISKSEANNIIQRFEEFGQSYFDVSKIVRISPESYRAIAPAVKDQAIEWNGESIPLTSENKDRVTAAVQALRQAAALPKPAKRAIEAVPQPPQPISQDPADDRLGEIEQRMSEMTGELLQMCKSSAGGSRDRQRVQRLAHHLRLCLYDVECAAA